MNTKINTWLMAGIFLLQIVIIVLLIRNHSSEKTVVIDEPFMKSFTESFVTSLNKIQSVPVAISVPAEMPPPQISEKGENIRIIEIQADRVSINGDAMSVSEFEKQAPRIVGPTTKVLLQKGNDTNYKTSIEVLDVLRKNGVVQISIETVYGQPPK